MNLLAIFRPRRTEPRTERRYYAATRAESKAAQHRRLMVELQLAIGASVLTPEQRKAAIARASVRGA